MTEELPHWHAVIPMKPLAEAKSRLAASLPPLARHALVLMMLQRVVTAVLGGRGSCRCTVVGGDERVRQVAELAGARWMSDPASDLNASVWAAMQAVYAEGAEAALFLPGDLPLITAGDVDEIAHAGRRLMHPIGVPSTEGGTNALWFPAALAFEPLLGEGSYTRHQEAAKRAGTMLNTLELPRVMTDLDTPDVYERTKASQEGFSALLTDWQTWLHEGGVAPPPACPLVTLKLSGSER